MSPTRRDSTPTAAWGQAALVYRPRRWNRPPERLEVEPHVFQQFRLVPLQRKNVVRAALHDFGRHGFLAAHRICRNNSSRYVYHVQQFRDGLDFVRFLRNADLLRNEPVLRRECADDVVCSVFGTGSTASNTRRNVSASGMPLGDSRNLRSQSSLSLPNISMSAKSSPSLTTVHRPMIIMSSNLWSTCPCDVRRGSSAFEMHSLSVCMSMHRN